MRPSDETTRLAMMGTVLVSQNAEFILHNQQRLPDLVNLAALNLYNDMVTGLTQENVIHIIWTAYALGYKDRMAEEETW